MRLGIEFLQRLYQNDKQCLSLTQDLLWDFSLYYPDKASTFESVLLGDDVRRRYVTISTTIDSMDAMQLLN